MTCYNNDYGVLMCGLSFKLLYDLSMINFSMIAIHNDMVND